MKDGELNRPGMRRRRWWFSRRALGLRTRIAALLGVLVFGLAASMGGVLGTNSLNQLRDRLGASVQSDADALADRLNKEMAARAREVELVSELGPVRDLSAQAPASQAAVRVLLERLKTSFPAYIWIGVATPAGRVLAATGGVLEGVDVSARASFQNVLTPRGVPGSDSTQQARSLLPKDDRRVIDIVHPVLDTDAHVVAVVFAQLSWDWIDQTAAAVLRQDSGEASHREAYLVSSDSKILLGPADMLGQTLALPEIARARAGYTGWTVADWPDGARYLTGSAYAAGEGTFPGPGSQKMQWTVLVRQPAEQAFRVAAQLRRDILLAGIALAVVFASIGWLLASWICAPLARMATAAERLRQGDDVEMPLLRGAFEIESLSISLRALVASLTRKQVALDEMEALTERDPLTNLLNRNGLRKFLDHATRRARNNNLTLLIFLGDLDGFKQINDGHGHAAGDAVLCEVAARLLACVRHYDAVARFGGDEFVLVLEAANGPADAIALQIAQRVLESLSAPVRIGAQSVPVGCSFGGAAWPQDGVELDTVIERADEALYTVKRGGRGRLLLHGAWMSNPA